MAKIRKIKSPALKVHRIKRAFLWMVNILERNKIPFKITGGFAVCCHGANREIADIDFEIDDKYMEILGNEVKQYINFGPGRYKDDEWDLELIELTYKDQDIDIGGVVAKVFNPQTKKWEDCISDLNDYELVSIYGKQVRIHSIDSLIDYKTQLGREVDIKDIKLLREVTCNNNKKHL